MKRIISLLLLGVFLCISAGAAGNPDIKIVVNGEELKTDSPPIMRDGRVLVPLRAICEALGCEVKWDSKEQIAYIYNTDTILEIEIGSKSIVRQTKGKGFNPIMLDVPAVIFQGRTMVPIRAIAECFDAKVDWDPKTKTVDIDVKLSPPTPKP